MALPIKFAAEQWVQLLEVLIYAHSSEGHHGPLAGMGCQIPESDTHGALGASGFGSDWQSSGQSSCQPLCCQDR